MTTIPINRIHNLIARPYLLYVLFFLKTVQIYISSLIVVIMDEGQSADEDEDIHQIKSSKNSKSNRRSTKGIQK